MDRETMWALLCIAMFGVGVVTGICAYHGFLDYRQMYRSWRAARSLSALRERSE
jgi:hypothetical protein